MGGGTVMAQRQVKALTLMLIMFMAPLAGCFGEVEEKEISANALTVEGSGPLQGGMWQQITVAAKEDLAVYIPYFIQDPGSMRAQNGTVLDLSAGESVSVNILFPPRNDNIVFFVGDMGRIDWPIRASDESWATWLANPANGSAVQAVPNEDVGGEWPWLVPGNNTGGEAVPVVMETERPARADLTEADGVGASDGWVNGRDVFECHPLQKALH